MYQFNLHTVLFAVHLIGLSKWYITVVETSSDSNFMVTVNSDESSEEYSNFTITYDKRDGFKIVPLTEPQVNEVVFTFDTEKDVRFELFTPQNPSQPHLLTLGDHTTVKKSQFKWWRQTRILIHGWYISYSFSSIAIAMNFF